MTADIAKLDAEIAEASDKLVAALERIGQAHKLPEIERLLETVAAKRAAMKPRLLTPEECRSIWTETCGSGAGYQQGWEAVLTACLERAYKVIEALPHKQPTLANCGFDGGLRSVADIKSALDGRIA